MATPVVSGLALLVRQYFMEGRYPRGVKTSVDRFVPSGALVKAIIINSAVRMQQWGSAAQTIILGPPPDNYQGFGKPQLSRVLRLGVGTDQPGLSVADSRPLSEGSVHSYKFTVRDNYTVPPFNIAHAFEVTLTWRDPPVAVDAARIVLHDLDLVASLDLSGMPVQKKFPNNRVSPDDINIVEKIRIQDLIPGDVITVNVTGTSITTTPTQTYALVASGPLVSGAWYCQDPRSDRTDMAWRTEFCLVPCETFSKSPLCCETRGGRPGSVYGGVEEE